MLEQLPDALGEALEGVRAGLDQTLFHAIDLRSGMAAITLQSLAFADHAPIPEKYSADGEGSSPPLHWSGVPKLATELVLIVEDADSPTPHPLVHAIAIERRSLHPPADPGSAAEEVGSGAGDMADAIASGAQVSGAFAEGAMSGTDGCDPVATMGRNSLLQAQWLPPDPPPGHGVHRFVFQLFALEAGEPLPETPGRDAVRNAIAERGLASGCLIGTYERPSGRIDAPLSQSLAAPASATAAPFAAAG
ncbi:MAG: YbhB/YbcL family Raf kinase inhibitor-like protein [Rubrivivax sp.]